MRCALFTLGLLALIWPATAGDSDFKAEPGFESLFNGKDLTGWKYYKETDLAGKTETSDKRFTIKDGAIVAEEGKGIKDLFTVKEFSSDFHLKLEFRASLKSDSGVYVRAAGSQLQVRDYIRRNERKQLTKFKNDDWNTLDIIVRGGKLSTIVNGKALTAKDDLKVSVANGKATAVLNGNPVDIAKIEVAKLNVAECSCNGEFLENMNVPAKGGIGLQAETGKFEFRRLRVKMLDGAAKSSAVAPVSTTTGNGLAKKRLLLITESRGFVHDVVNRRKTDRCLVEKTFEALAAKHKFFEVECSQDSNKALEPENLKKFDAVFFYTTGELPLSDTQKTEFINFIKSGKGFGGSHCATDTFYKWADYGDMIGAYFDGHPWNAGTKIKVIVEDKKHPATKHLGDSFEISDEIYQFKAPYSRDKLKVLMKLDVESVKNIGKRKDKDYALAWVREFGKGRVFYTALGHQPEVWNDERFQNHIIGGLRYMFNVTEEK